MSTTPWTLEALLDLAPGYVFGGLDAAELAAFEQGLASPECRAALEAEVTALREASDALVREGAVSPPPSLRDRLQARIAEEAGTQHAAQVAGDVAARATTPASSASVPEPVVAPGAPPAARVPDALDEIRARINAGTAGERGSVAGGYGDPLADQRAPVSRTSPGSRAVRVTPVRSAAVMDDLARRRPSKAGWYATAVMAAGLAAVAFFALDLRNRVGALETEAREKTALVTRLETKLTEKERTLATLLAGRGNVVLVTLDATAPTGPGMQVFWNVREGKAVVNAYGLAQVAPDRAYMLWMIRDGKPVPVKLFTPDESGRALVADVAVPNTTTGVTLLAVTEESAQGAEAPTMTPFLAGAVSASGVK